VAGFARDLFRAAYARRVSVRLLGVGLSNLVSAAPQLDLFSAPRELAWERLIGPLDGLRDRFGFGAVRAGSSILLARDGDSTRVSRQGAHSKRE
jgi:hypothetical protein